jgi:hypothetical protein
VVPCRGTTQAELEKLLNKIQRPVRGVLDVQMEIVDSISLGSTGKRKLVDQRIADVNDE